MISHGFRHVCRLRCSRESCKRALRATVDRYLCDPKPTEIELIMLFTPREMSHWSYVLLAQHLPYISSEFTSIKHPTPSDHLASLSALSDKFILVRCPSGFGPPSPYPLADMDPPVQIRLRINLRKKASKFFLEDSVLFYAGQRNSEPRRWVYDLEEQRRVLAACHSDNLAGHFGRDKTRNKVGFCKV